MHTLNEFSLWMIFGRFDSHLHPYKYNCCRLCLFWLYHKFLGEIGQVNKAIVYHLWTLSFIMYGEMLHYASLFTTHIHFGLKHLTTLTASFWYISGWPNTFKLMCFPSIGKLTSKLPSSKCIINIEWRMETLWYKKIEAIRLLTDPVQPRLFYKQHYYTLTNKGWGSKNEAAWNFEMLLIQNV